MKQYHSLLNKQIENHLTDIDKISEEFSNFLKYVSESYKGFDNDRKKVEQSLDLSTEELLKTNSELNNLVNALKESEERYKILFDQSPHGICIINNNLKIIQCNQRMVEISQLTIDDLIGLDVNNFINDSFVHSVKKAIEGEICCDETYYEISTNSSKLYLSTKLVPITKTNNGDVIGVMAVIEDISKRRKTENKLIENEKKYRSIVENTSDVVFEATYEGKFLYVSPNCYNIVGFTQEELIGSSIFEYIHPDDLAAAIKEFSSAIKEMRPGSITLRSKHKNGEWKWFDTVGKPYTTASNEINAVITAQDITEKRKAEEESLKIAKLDSLSVLAGGIAHDFNNMLTTILGNLYLIQNYDGKDEQTYKKNLKDLENAVGSATNLTQQLLTFSKGGSPVKETASIKELLIESTNFALRGSNILCDLVMPEDLNNVEIDKGQIEQVIQNLVINSKQAMPEGGKIELTAKNVRKDEFNNNKLSPGDYVEIILTDYGVGIPNNYISKIFDPYFTTKEEGSGLGLATCYSIIKKHNGTIEVESEVGVGTIFKIILPTTEKKIKNQDQVKVTTFQGKGKVLIMDDEIGIRDILTRIFNDLGFETDEASNGNEAIQKCENILKEGENYILAILDLTIRGGMGGRKLQRNCQR